MKPVENAHLIEIRDLKKIYSAGEEPVAALDAHPTRAIQRGTTQIEQTLGTMVNGRWLYRNGDYPTLDKEEILDKARSAREAILN